MGRPPVEVEQETVAPRTLMQPATVVQPGAVATRGRARGAALWRYGAVGSLIALALLIGGQWYRSQQPAEEARQPPEAARQAPQAEPESKGEKEQGQQEAVVKPPSQEQQPQQQAKVEPPKSAEQVWQEAEERKKAEAAQRVAELLEKAKKQRVAKRLTTPAGDNVLETYKEVLRVAPGHEEALAGVREIKEQYRQLADAAQQKGEWAKAQGHYEAALKIDPQDGALIAALQQAKEARKGAEALAGWYETTSSTPVLKEPRKDATVIANLSTKKRVYVAGAAGDYLRIESVRGNPPGYISRKDVTRAQGELESTGGEQQAALEKPRTETEQQLTGAGIRQSVPEEARHDLKDAIIGKWEEAGHGIATLEFFKDGTVIIVDKLHGVERRGNYQFIDDNRFRLEVGGAVTLLFAASDGNNLKLISPDGSSRPGFYKRVKSQLDSRSEHTRTSKELEHLGIPYSQEAFIKSVQNNDLPAMESFLAAGMNPNVKGEYGTTALMFAISYGHTAIAKALLDKGADVNAENNYGMTALMFAAAHGHTAVAKALLDKGVDVNMKANDGRTALSVAREQGHSEIVQLLKQAGAWR